MFPQHAARVTSPIAQPRSAKALEKDLVTLETQYNECSELLAQGEAVDFGAECPTMQHKQRQLECVCVSAIAPSCANKSGHLLHCLIYPFLRFDFQEIGTVPCTCFHAG